MFSLKKFADAAGADNFAVSDADDLSPVFDNLSVPLCTHRDIRYAATIVLIGGEPEEEQSFTAKQIRQAVRNGGAKFICINDTPINLVRQTGGLFVHANPGTAGAFALCIADLGILTGLPPTRWVSKQPRSTRSATRSTRRRAISSLWFGSELSANAQAILAASAAKLGGDGRRVLLHPLARYNNSVGANDMAGTSKPLDDVIKGEKHY